MTTLLDRAREFHQRIQAQSRASTGVKRYSIFRDTLQPSRGSYVMLPTDGKRAAKRLFENPADCIGTYDREASEEKIFEDMVYDHARWKGGCL